jgi:hypothetical protein
MFKYRHNVLYLITIMKFTTSYAVVSLKQYIFFIFQRICDKKDLADYS